MTYREKYFQLAKLKNKYLNQNVIKSLLIDCGGFSDFINLLNHFDEEITNIDKLESNISRVMNGEPYQYVLGYAYFVNSNYKVNKDVLIPRQETEELAVSTLKMIVNLFGKDPEITIVDIGTGSGVLGIYLKEYFPKSRVICTDISENSLQIAKINSKEHAVEIDFRQGDSIKPIQNEKGISVIVSNPPYIKDETTVSEETLKWEPHLALFADPYTKFYEDIMSLMDTYVLADSFLLAFEIGEDMEEDLTHIIETRYKDIAYKFEKDIYNKTRFLYIVKKEGISDVQ